MQKPVQYPFCRATVEKLSWLKGEPAWMTRLRLSAWEVYEKCRRTDAAEISLESIEAFTDPPRNTVPSHQWPANLQHALDERGDEEGLIIQRDSTVLSRSITKEQSKRGVLFTDMDTAVKTAPELVRRYFTQVAKVESSWTALNTAFWSGGAFLYVPAHVHVHLPFHACCWMTMPGVGVFPHTVLVAESGSLTSFIDETVSPDWSSPSAMSVGVVEMVVHEKARMEYSLVQNWGQGVYHRGQRQSRVAPSGSLQCLEMSGHRPPVTLERVAELHPEVRA